ncbi:phosphoenolpyruvate--protein phosphotransferase [Desulfobacter hydrogenophilus]|uniref:Phosphoenolpyruvate-protein phosphotransferase n=1 Tax=Desulfobacter hydrogenophilus TaxID=2291 RepID=A0A328FGS6_9BACT|nr:phosphoenolpyruvate--protein phosphotransferase [Desulfobacter hydrogenophilus]QBH13978.1 phosphoenolpyruvate--protein phosphotransferase [Desulfobacter hydrogenophilus]RAM03609.1 phosphoenolpyruvate--protein phosphotransferase [Desulfobacter hydrogenophilus]
MKMNRTVTDQITLRGLSGSPGICIGKAYLVDREGVNLIKRYPVSPDMVPNEIDRFKNAVDKAKKDHARAIDSLGDDLSENLNILETHMVLFKDKMLYGKTIDTITSDHVNAEWALRRVSRRISRMFDQINDPYLRARGDDIIQVSDKIMTYLVGEAEIRISEINKRVIIVAHDLSPADTSQIQLEHIKGFITDRGGKDSHTSIVAKSLKIPSVLGLGNATANINNDAILIVDGSAGIVIINPDEDTLFRYEDKMARFAAYRADIERDSHLPAITADGIPINLLANIELVEEVVSAKDNKAAGIGLFRTEFLCLDLNRLPTEDQMLQKYGELAELMHPAPVTIRTLDINGDKFNPYIDPVKEANPALGLRAVRFCLENEGVFIAQIKAILRAAAFGNINLLIPMISCVEEIIGVKSCIDKAVIELESEDKIFNKDIPLGIMIEVPSAVMMARELAEYVDFFSIGTNDLIQYSMAIDRRNRRVAHLYQALNPAVLKMIRLIVDAAAEKNIEVFMCGEMAGDAINIPVLLGLGLTNLSMNAGAIPVIKKMIRSMNVSKARKDVQTIFGFQTVQKIVDYIQTEYRDLLPYKDNEE